MSCVFCTACYTTCDGATAGCTSAPPSTDACDTGTPGQSACQACQQCSLGANGTCANQLAACRASQQCIDLAQNLGNTCGSLPQ